MFFFKTEMRNAGRQVEVDFLPKPTRQTPTQYCWFMRKIGWKSSPSVGCGTPTWLRNLYDDLVSFGFHTWGCLKLCV